MLWCVSFLMYLSENSCNAASCTCYYIRIILCSSQHFCISNLKLLLPWIIKICKEGGVGGWGTSHTQNIYKSEKRFLYSLSQIGKLRLHLILSFIVHDSYNWWNIFICIWLVLFLQFIGNFQETCGMRTGWGAGECAFRFIYRLLTYCC